MDRNKAAYKLKDFGPVYCINLDEQPERWMYMQAQFKYWEVENFERISAYDGREDDLSDILKGRYPDHMSSGEVGCTTSHLKAIRHWLDTSDSPYAIMMEDDCSLDLVSYWNFTWNDFMAKVPYDWDLVQIAVICTGDVNLRSKRELIEKFIDETLVNLDDGEEIEEAFQSYWGEEKLKAFNQLCEEEKLDKSKIQAIVDDYLFANQVISFNQKIDDALLVRESLLKRRKTIEKVKERILSFIQVYVEGIAA